MKGRRACIDTSRTLMEGRTREFESRKGWPIENRLGQNLLGLVTYRVGECRAHGEENLTCPAEGGLVVWWGGI